MESLGRTTTMHSSSSSLARKLSMTSTWLVVQIRCSAHGFGVRNRETLGGLHLGRIWPTSFILASCGPTRQVIWTWVVVLSRSRQSLFSPVSAPCTRVGAPLSRPAPQPVGVASQPVGGLTQLSLFRRSVYQAPMAGWRRASSSFSLQPIGGLLPRPVEVFPSINNHSSSESNEASPLALISQQVADVHSETGPQKSIWFHY